MKRTICIICTILFTALVLTGGNHKVELKKKAIEKLDRTGHIFPERKDFKVFMYMLANNSYSLSVTWNPNIKLTEKQKDKAEIYLEIFFFDAPYKMADFVFNQGPDLVGDMTRIAVLHIMGGHLYYNKKSENCVQLFVEYKRDGQFAEHLTRWARRRIEKGKKINGDEK